MLAFAGGATANQSLALLPGTSSSLTVPAIPTFSTLSSTRLEFRVNHWIPPASTATILSTPGLAIQLHGNGELCAIDKMDALAQSGNTMCANIAGQQDVVVRVQRDLAALQLRYEVSSTNGSWIAPTYCGIASQAFACPISAPRLGSWAGAGTLGDSVSNVQLAWLKWSSSTLPAGSMPPTEGTPADLADWRFEGDLQNSATGGYAVTIGPLSGATPNAGGATEGVIFAPTPVYSPVCNAGVSQILHTAQGALDGTRSYPLDGGTALTFSWSQTAGPATVAWYGATSTQPTVSGLTPGVYSFQLSVKDGIGQSSSCSTSVSVASSPQSVQVSGSGVPTLQLPATAPWTTIGASGNAMRWEMRLHNFGSNWPVQGINFGPLYLWSQNSQLAWAASNFNADTVYNNGVYIQNCCSGRSDVLVRVQRDVANRQYTLEICDTTGGNCASSTSPITSYGPTSWAGMGLSLYSGESVAFLRWFSGVVPIGTPIPILATADIADWEFDGNLTDSVQGIAFSGGSVSYPASTPYPPSCNAGLQQTFRAGFPGTLDGSGSSPLNGDATLNYSWAQVPGISPVNVTWNGTQHNAKPTIAGFVFGSYNFQLTVTDGSGQSSTCVVHDGAVATDDNNVVITNNPAVDILLGPMMRWGYNTWPWIDDRHKYLADSQIGNLKNIYKPYFNIPATGTISAAAGSATLVGIGTHFTTDVCQGPSAPATPQSNMAIIPWWNGGNNRRAIFVQSCTDDTHLTLSAPWNPPPTSYPQNESGLTYSLDNFYGIAIWGENSNNDAAQRPINYYDNVAALYNLYYRSGFDTYLNYARLLADEFWQSPPMDQGLSYLISSNGALTYAGYQWMYAQSRSWSIMGMVLRALDGKPDMWAGLHVIWDNETWHLANDLYPGNDPRPYGIGDQREYAYRLMRRAMCGLFDTDSTYRSTCKASLVTQLNNMITPVYNHYGKAYFPSYNNAGTSIQSWGNGKDTYVSAVNGSSTVTLYSPTQHWTFNPANFPAMIWMYPCAKPIPTAGIDCGIVGNDGGDPLYYASYLDATHLTLTNTSGTPIKYAGATGYKGVYMDGPTTTDIGIGWGMQPFMQGIVSAAFDLASTALADGNYDLTSAATYRTYEAGTLSWLATNGLYAPAKGMWYYLGYVNCPAANPDPVTCGQPNPTDPGAARILNSEAVRGGMFAYLNGGQDPTIKSFVDLMVNAMFAKPGTCPSGSTVCLPDGHYIDGFDNGQFFADCVSNSSPCNPVYNGGNPKYFGMFAGLNPTPGWAAARIGGAQSASLSSIEVPLNLRLVPGSVGARVKVTAPSGEVNVVSCSTSSCRVPIDRRIGDHLIDVEYLGSDGKVLRTLHSGR